MREAPFDKVLTALSFGLSKNHFEASSYFFPLLLVETKDPGTGTHTGTRLVRYSTSTCHTDIRYGTACRFESAHPFFLFFWFFLAFIKYF